MQPLLPKTHEALIDKDPEYTRDFKSWEKRAYGNPWYERYLKFGMKEGILSDMAGAIGRIHDVVVEAAKPNLIGREI